MLTIETSRITFYPTRDAAIDLAITLQADDPGTEYRVVHAARGFFVAIFEDGDTL